MSPLRLLWHWWAARRRPKTLGQRGEEAAARYLRCKGYRIVSRGARDRMGELDIVAVDGRTVVFVEVKTRSSHDAGHPAEAVTAEKQRQVARAALSYLKQHQLLECACRFDVVAVTWPATERHPEIEHWPAAFDAPGRGQMFS